MLVFLLAECDLVDSLRVPHLNRSSEDRAYGCPVELVQFLLLAIVNMLHRGDYYYHHYQC